MAAEHRITLASVWKRETVLTRVLIIFILVSLALHAYTLARLWQVRGVTAQQLELSANRVAQVRQHKVNYNFPIDQNFAIDTTVTISDTVQVPLRLNVPIKQTIQLPIDTPFGSYTMDVPLDLSVPINETVTIPINKQIPFKTNIPVKINVPIEIDPTGPPVGDILKQFEDALRQLRESL